VPASIPARPADPRPERCAVAIVGAGIAGLSAAVALVRRGVDVVVLEARDRVGGRLLSLTDADATVDLGATWFWPDEPAVLKLAADLGLPTFPQYRAGDALFERDRTTVQRLDGNPLDGLSARFAAGSQALTARLADSLAPGVLRPSTPVSSVSVTEHGVHLGTADGDVIADAIVLALPPALAAERIAFDPPLPPELRDTAAHTAVWMGDTVKAVAVFDKPFWRSVGLSGSAMSHAGPFREFHDHSGPDGRTAALFAFASAAHVAHLDTPQIDVAFRRQLVRLFGVAAAQVRATHIVDWSREPYTSPSDPVAGASTRTYGAPAFQQPVHDRVHWASTETATAYAGYIEGAVRAGRDVASRLSATSARPAV
jgi:monoamine oxidase